MNVKSPAGELAKAQDAAAWAPLLCAVHCVTVPALALVVPALMVPEAIEQALMAGATLIALVLLHTGVRAHGHWPVLAPVAAGLAFWGAALSDVTPAPEWVVGGAGGVLMFVGLRWNARLHHAAVRRCGCGQCES